MESTQEPIQQLKIFHGAASSVQEEMNQWLRDSRPTITRLVQSWCEELVITVVYVEKG